MTKQRVVVCAAMMVKAKNRSLLVCGARHYDKAMLRQMEESIIGVEWIDQPEQGFIDQHGVFMTREEAYEVAKSAGQIKYRCGGDEGKLFSENLY